MVLPQRTKGPFGRRRWPARWPAPTPESTEEKPRREPLQGPAWTRPAPNTCSAGWGRGAKADHGARPQHAQLLRVSPDAGPWEAGQQFLSPPPWKSCQVSNHFGLQLQAPFSWVSRVLPYQGVGRGEKAIPRRHSLESRVPPPAPLPDPPPWKSLAQDRAGHQGARLLTSPPQPEGALPSPEIPLL